MCVCQRILWSTIQVKFSHTLQTAVTHVITSTGTVESPVNYHWNLRDSKQVTDGGSNKFYCPVFEGLNQSITAKLFLLK